MLLLVKATVPAFTNAKLGTGGKNNEIIATLVALGILRKKCGEQQGVWKLIEQKAITWLQSQGVDYEPLIARVMAALTDETSAIQLLDFRPCNRPHRAASGSMAEETRENAMTRGKSAHLIGMGDKRG